MNYKTTFLIILLIIAMSVFVRAEQFTTTQTIKTGGGYVNITTEGDDLKNLHCNTSLELPLTIVFDRDTTLDCVNYDKIKNIVNNISAKTNLSCSGLNRTEMEEAIQNIIPEQFADQQDYLQNTLVKQETDFANLRDEKTNFQKDLETCQNTIKAERQSMNVVNSTYSERIDECKSDQSTTNWMLALSLLANIILIVYMTYGKQLINQRTGRK